jgi:hypothetical protein
MAMVPEREWSIPTLMVSAAWAGNVENTEVAKTAVAQQSFKRVRLSIACFLLQSDVNFWSDIASVGYDAGMFYVSCSAKTILVPSDENAPGM